MPFGGGARRCLGAAFALYEMKVALGTLLAGHRFSLAHDRPIRPVRRHITFAPEDGVPLRYEGPGDARSERLSLAPLAQGGDDHAGQADDARPCWGRSGGRS